MKAYRHLSTVTGLFTATIVITNVLNSKIFELGPFALPAGIITFPLAFLFGDILTEVYGYGASRRVIWTGFTALIFMVFAIEIGRLLPSAPFWANQTAYMAILGQVPRIVLASISAYFCGEFCNSYVLARFKVRTDGRGMPLRFVASTVIGQAVDTIIFVSVAFAGTFAIGQLVVVSLSSWVFKVVWEILALPATLPVVRFLKRAEQEDYFDRDTNFSPFHL